jgi:hypothetical protein
MASFMADLQKLEDEAVLQEGRLLAKGQTDDLPFNFTSYIAPLPLEAAFAALAKAGESYSLVVSGEDEATAAAAVGQRAFMKLYSLRSGAWQLVVERRVGRAEARRDREVIMEVGAWWWWGAWTAGVCCCVLLCAAVCCCVLLCAAVCCCVLRCSRSHGM